MDDTVPVALVVVAIGVGWFGKLAAQALARLEGTFTHRIAGSGRNSGCSANPLWIRNVACRRLVFRSLVRSLGQRIHSLLGQVRSGSIGVFLYDLFVYLQGLRRVAGSDQVRQGELRRNLGNRCSGVALQFPIVLFGLCGAVCLLINVG